LIASGNATSVGNLDVVAAEHPRLLIAALTPYGLTGPDRDRAASTFTLAAESGWLAITGSPDSPPEMMRGHFFDYSASAALASAVMAVVVGNVKSGQAGGRVDVSMLEVLAFLQWMATQRAEFEGISMERHGPRGSGGPWGVYPCKDGHVVVIVGAGGRNWGRFAELMQAPELADSKFATPLGRSQNSDLLDALMFPWLMDHSADEVFHAAQAVGLPFGKVVFPAGLLKDEQLSDRDFFQVGDDGLKWPQLPFNINGQRAGWPSGMAGG
jgi:crotonobetainyl-CoA:carnitine CoA-transferase CaiB-like acyl-CoA transferase